MGQIALFFAELAGRRAVWSDALKEWNMYESQLFKEWTAEADRRAEVRTRRETILEALKERFPVAVPQEVVDVINHQDSLDILREWNRAALRASSLEDFLTVLRR
jgi:hypothetical protein